MLPELQKATSQLSDLLVTLIGTFLGVLGALGVALYIQRRRRRQEEDEAAEIISRELKTFIAHMTGEERRLNKADTEEIGEDAYKRFAIHERQVYLRYQSPLKLIDNNIGRIQHVDHWLSERLRLFRYRISRAEQKYRVVETRVDNVFRDMEPPENVREKARTQRFKKAWEELKKAEVHAMEALIVLDKLFGGPKAVWNRLLRRCQLLMWKLAYKVDEEMSEYFMPSDVRQLKQRERELTEEAQKGELTEEEWKRARELAEVLW